MEPQTLAEWLAYLSRAEAALRTNPQDREAADAILYGIGRMQASGQTPQSVPEWINYLHAAEAVLRQNPQEQTAMNAAMQASRTLFNTGENGNPFATGLIPAANQTDEAAAADYNPGAIPSAIVGFGEGASMGLASRIGSAIPVGMDNREYLAAARETNPWTTGLSDLAGMIATGGLASAALPRMGAAGLGALTSGTRGLVEGGPAVGLLAAGGGLVGGKLADKFLGPVVRPIAERLSPGVRRLSEGFTRTRFSRGMDRLLRRPEPLDLQSLDDFIMRNPPSPSSTARPMSEVRRTSPLQIEEPSPFVRPGDRDFLPTATGSSGTSAASTRASLDLLRREADAISPDYFPTPPQSEVPGLVRNVSPTGGGSPNPAALPRSQAPQTIFTDPDAFPPTSIVSDPIEFLGLGGRRAPVSGAIPPAALSLFAALGQSLLRRNQGGQ